MAAHGLPLPSFPPRVPFWPGLLLGVWCFLMREPRRGQADQLAAAKFGPGGAPLAPASVEPPEPAAA